MKLTASRFKKTTLLSAAGYFFVFALAAKGVVIFGSDHPLKEELLSVNGVVRQVRLGGQGKSTWFRVESGGGTHRYSSYYGKVWPGMERIRPKDHVRILAERNKLNRDELISGKSYYIWELVHDNQVIMAYDDVRDIVKGTEATVNRYADGFLVASVVLLLIAYLRKLALGSEIRA
jgi:hypothetical protein